MITPMAVTVLCTYASSTESSSNNLQFGFEDNDSFYWKQVRDIMNSKTTDITYCLAASPGTSGACETSILNKPFICWANAAFNGGWSCDIYVTYAYTKVL